LGLNSYITAAKTDFNSIH